MVGERVGGPSIWIKGVANPLDTPSESPHSINGAGWGDVLNGDHSIEGSSADGTSADGPCAINCNNRRNQNYYSFHPGGCHFLVADGSVRFISETTELRVLASMMTRANGETFTMP